jgi:tight adherence protein C
VTVIAFLVIGAGAFFAAILVAVLALVWVAPGRSGVVRTLAAVEQTYAVGSAPDPDASFVDRVGRPLAGRFGAIGRWLTPAGALSRYQRYLDYAGNPPGWTPERVVDSKGAGLVVGGFVGAFLGLLYAGVEGLAIGPAIGAAIGAFLPDLLVYNRGLRRQQEIRRSLPDILDMLTVSVEAGLGFDAALSQVARGGKGPMVGESARVLHEMQIGMRRADALRAMAARTKITELRTFAAAVVQAGELGIPIANVLREQAKEMRVKRRQRAEEQAQKVPVKILFPLILCIFPVLFVVVIGPGVLRMLGSFGG